MPLDSQMQPLLEMMNTMMGPPLGTVSPEETRRLMDERRATMPPGEPVARVQDLSAPGPAGEIALRVYTPAGPTPQPVVVFYHGGGWVIGSIDSHDATARALANRSGCTVVSVEYRLAPEHKFPAAAEDSYAATVWVAEHAAECGGDPTRLAVAGDSAGGNLAAVVALLARERGGPRIAFQLLVYPVTDCNYDTGSYTANAEGYFLTKASMVWFWDHYLSSAADAANPVASPLRAESLAGLPPALVITAEFDPLRDEGEAYAKRLEAAGVPVVCTRYDGVIHGFFGMGDALDKARAAQQQAGEALRSALGVAATANR